MAQIKITCQRCRCEFPAKPYRVNTAKFCSRKCRMTAITKICQRCGRVFKVGRGRDLTARWCSYKCAATKTFPEFWDNVDKGKTCWVWHGLTDKDGYGKYRRGRAHRFAWEITSGSSPGVLAVLHKCDNPPCCNPAHLFLGTNAENMRDKINKGRQPRGEQLTGTKLTEEKVRQIRVMAHNGQKHQAIANLFGVDRTNIGLIVRRQTWAHVH